MFARVCMHMCIKQSPVSARMPNRSGIGVFTAFIPRERSPKLLLGNNFLAHFEGICVPLIAQPCNFSVKSKYITYSKFIREAHSS